jgi:hypothetical protein
MLLAKFGSIWLRSFRGEDLFNISQSETRITPLKLLDKMEPNLAGNIYVRSSIEVLHLVPFGK